MGLKVTHIASGIALTQKKFTTELLQAAAIDHLRPVSTPLPLNCKLINDLGELYSDPTYYRMLLGTLNFLTNTRPDLSFVVQCLSQFMQAPRVSHFHALQHVLRYVKRNSRPGYYHECY